MRKYLAKTALTCLILLGCGKVKDNGNYQYYLDVYIDNVRYSTSSVSTFVLANQLGCGPNKIYNLTNVGQINVDAYYLDCYMKHFGTNVDFKLTKPGAHKIFDGGTLLSTSNCNFDLVIGLVDNSIPNLFNNTLLQQTNIVNNITSIIKKDSTVATMTYAVAGNFSCNFKNTDNKIIPVIGNYTIPLRVTR